MSTNRNRRPQNVDSIVTKIKEDISDSKDNLYEETIWVDHELYGDNEETIIADSAKNKKEESENNSSQRKDDNLHTNDNKIISSRQKKWLYIVIPVIGLIIGIFIVNSILSYTSNNNVSIKGNKELQKNM